MKPYELTLDKTRNNARSFHGMQAGIWTALPGIVQSFNPVAKTCVIRPAIKAIVFAQDGTATDVELPMLLDCPVFFPSGGGCTLTFPIAAGDECLVVFSSRCIDAWWYSGGVQVQAEMRMHDLSDGFAFVGVSSLPNVQSGISTSSVQLRSNDGAAYVSIDPASHNVAVNTSGNINATSGAAVNVTASGAVNITSAVAVNVTAPAINLGASGQSLLGLVTSAMTTLFNGHTHTDPQGGATSAPLQTMGAAQITTTVKGG